jgi:hypothetical protein
MLKINKKLSKDSGHLMILKDGAFGDQSMNYTKVKEKLDISLAT